MYGTEGDSPTALRGFSLALLNHAKSLDNNIVPDDEFNDWKNRIAGTKGAFTCTAVLSRLMIDFIYKQLDVDYKNTLAALLPIAWIF